MHHAAVDGAIAGGSGSSTFLLRRRRLEIECTNPAARPCDLLWSSPCPALNVSEAALTQYLRIRARWEKHEKTRRRGKATTSPTLNYKMFDLTLVCLQNHAHEQKYQQCSLELANARNRSEGPHKKYHGRTRLLSVSADAHLHRLHTIRRSKCYYAQTNFRR